MRVLVILASQYVSARILNFLPHFLHRPIELALELTDCCARARDFGTVACECLHFEPSLTCPPSGPDGTLRAPLFGLQGAGVHVNYMAVAHFEGCNIYENDASKVCLHP